jgi:hypothetical protein
MAGNALYDTDLYAWTRAQAELLRARRFDELDVEHLAEEIESVGSKERRELRHCLALLMHQLLRYDYQSELRCRSWRTAIMMQRHDIEALLSDNASLREGLKDMLAKAYELSRIWTEHETGLESLPSINPYSVDDVLTGELRPL